MTPGMNVQKAPRTNHSGQAIPLHLQCLAGREEVELQHISDLAARTCLGSKRMIINIVSRTATFIDSIMHPRVPNCEFVEFIFLEEN